MQSTKGLAAVSGTAMVMALLQSLCTAILTINGIRVGIGVAALAASSIAAPLLSFHRDAIRIPMLSIAVVGAVVNLAVLAWVWRLRSRPESQWRQQPVTKKQRWSERLQVAMAIATLLLAGLEIYTHPIVNHGASAF
ncbi:MAG: hypothetical protein ABSE36_03575 [Terracidiphilus sp.]